MKDYIPVELCVPRGVYAVDGRNFSLAVWTGTYFIGIRHKMGMSYLSGEQHYDSDENFGTVNPFRLVGAIPDSIEMKTDEPIDWRDVHGGKEGCNYSRTYAPLFDYLAGMNSSLEDLDDEPV